MIVIRHVPRTAGILPLGRALRLLTESAMAHAAWVERRERERMQTKDAVRIHVPEPELEPVAIEPRRESRQERQDRHFREMRITKTWSKSMAWADQPGGRDVR